MKGKRKLSGQNWEFDGSTITVRIPMTFKHHGGRKVIIAPDGGDAWAPAKPRPDETLIRALARAHRWKRLLDAGRYRSAGELAEAEGLTRSFINRLLRLTLLAPDIVEAILDGRQPRGIQGDTDRGLDRNAAQSLEPAAANASSRNRRRYSRQRTPPRINPKLGRGPNYGRVPDGRKANAAISRESPLPTKLEGGNRTRNGSATGRIVTSTAASQYRDRVYGN